MTCPLIPLEKCGGVEKVSGVRSVVLKGDVTKTAFYLDLHRCSGPLNALLASHHHWECEWDFEGTDTYNFYNIYLPIKSINIDINMQQELCQIMADKGWHTGSFKDSDRKSVV